MDSDQVNDWRLILNKEEIQACVTKCANYINENFVGEDLLLVCILKGAVFFHVDLSRRLTVPHAHYFIEASSYKDSQTQSETIEVLSVINPDKFANKKIILIDELFDNGTTLYHTKMAISEKAGVPLDDIYTCTAFVKNKERNLPVPDIYGTLVPDVWLVGYGLDDRQLKRDWETLWACPKAEGVPKTKDDNIFHDNEYYSKIRYKLSCN